MKEFIKEIPVIGTLTQKICHAWFKRPKPFPGSKELVGRSLAWPGYL
jgi:hypothetical protein